MNATLLASLLAATLPAGSALDVDAAASTIRYQVDHKLHHVVGSSSSIEGKALVQEGGRVLAMVRVPVASFRSGDGNRDAHMDEVMEVGKYPFAIFKGVALLSADGQLPSGPLTMQGEIDLHGVKRPASVAVTLEPRPDGAMRVRGRFEVSLDAHGIERPSLLLVKIEDACVIDVDLLLREARP